MKVTDKTLIRIINGEKFAVIIYTNCGAHAPTVTSYPISNLQSLNSDWRFATIEDIEAGIQVPS